MSARRDVVAVGASAGGVGVLRAMAAGLPINYPGAVLVVLHVPRNSTNALPAILNRCGPLPAASAIDGEQLLPGRIYIAPTDRHLIVVDNHVRLIHGPAENGHRPAVDTLFRSVARAFGPRAIGVVLSGALDDGAAGLASIAAHGGTTVVQEPDDAHFPWMPRAALDHVTPDHLVPADKLGMLLARITAQPLSDSTLLDRDATLDAEVAMSTLSPTTSDRFAEPAGYGCPGCLFQIDDQPILRPGCRVGHAWSPESLLDEQASALERALWTALRALEQKSALSRRMAENRTIRNVASSARFSDMANDGESAGAIIRRLIAQIGAAGHTDRSTAPTDQPDGDLPRVR